MSYFNRKIDYVLLEWISEKRRKPLMLRGARQIGKTSAVRNDFTKYKKCIPAARIKEVFSSVAQNASCYTDDELYCWVRERKSANAQIDFVVHGIRSSLENFGQYDKVKVFPLYAIGKVITILCGNCMQY